MYMYNCVHALKMTTINNFRRWFLNIKCYTCTCTCMQLTESPTQTSLRFIIT